MGVRGDRNNPGKKPVYTEKSIQKILRAHFMSPNSMRYTIENLKVYSWESDNLSVTKSGYVYECEIKVTHADFLNDKKKERKHQILEGTYQLGKYEKTQPLKPNYFYYVVPEGLVKPEELPSYAGLIYITEIFPYVQTIVPAPKLTDAKIDEDALNLKEKFYYNYLSWKHKAEEQYEETIENLRRELHESKYDEDGNYHKMTLAQAEKRIHDLEVLVKIQEDASEKYKDEFLRFSSLCHDLRMFLHEKGVTQEEIKQRVSNFYKEYDR